MFELFFFGTMTNEFFNLSTRCAGDLRLRGNEMFYFFACARLVSLEQRMDLLKLDLHFKLFDEEEIPVVVELIFIWKMLPISHDTLASLADSVIRVGELLK